MTEKQKILDTVEVEKILKLLPHRYPFLLVDRVIDYQLGEHLTAIKNVTFNEPHFTGHFPSHPVMPGVLIIEAMAQASGILSRLAIGELQDEDDIFYLVKVDKAKFMQTVVPGDQLHLHVSIKRKMRNMVKYV
ncbi:3-hydroxyacyl-[acyl-carrier-protein] dehydratase, FabZ form, partial [hydrothermal vent metagenome]